MRKQDRLIRLLTASCAFVLLASSNLSCSSNSALPDVESDFMAHELLQGVWADDETDMPVFRFSQDTIFFAGEDRRPMSFRVIKDSLHIMGYDTLVYRIAKQSESEFWLQTVTDEIMQLHKSENEEDVLAFEAKNSLQPSETKQEQIKKDHVIVFNGKRYRGYVFINPTSKKVIRTLLDENGIGLEQVYYDNVIHICVYDGKKELYGRDIDKDMLADVIPSENESSVILADMDFVSVDSNGYHYQATVEIPDTSISYLVNLNISYQNELTIEAVG